MIQKSIAEIAKSVKEISECVRKLADNTKTELIMMEKPDAKT